jgi:hypothetical protein
MDDQADELFQSIEGGEPAPEPVIETPEPEPQAPPEPEIAAAPEPEAAKDEARHVPLPTFLEMRDKAKEAERRAEQAERQLRENQAAKAQTAPDPYDDPEGFAAYSQRLIQDTVRKERMDDNWDDEAEKNGLDKVTEARDWAVQRAERDPVFRAQLEQAMATERKPISWVVKQHKRDALLGDIGEDPDAYVRRRAVELGLTAPLPAPVNAVAAPQPAPVPPKVPRSLATQGSGPSDIRQIPTGPLVGLDAFS